MNCYYYFRPPPKKSCIYTTSSMLSNPSIGFFLPIGILTCRHWQSASKPRDTIRLAVALYIVRISLGDVGIYSANDGTMILRLSLCGVLHRTRDDDEYGALRRS